MRTSSLAFIVITSTWQLAAQPQPAPIVSVNSVVMYDSLGRLVGTALSIGHDRAQVAFRLASATDPADVIVLSYSWERSEWYPYFGNHHDIFFEGSNCSGRSFMDAGYKSPTPRFVAVSADYMLWVSEPRATPTRRTFTSRLQSAGVGTVRCLNDGQGPAQAPPPPPPPPPPTPPTPGLLLVEVALMGRLDLQFVPPLSVALSAADLPPITKRRRAVR